MTLNVGEQVVNLKDQSIAEVVEVSSSGDWVKVKIEESGTTAMWRRNLVHPVKVMELDPPPRWSVCPMFQPAAPCPQPSVASVLRDLATLLDGDNAKAKLFPKDDDNLVLTGESIGRLEKEVTMQEIMEKFQTNDDFYCTIVVKMHVMDLAPVPDVFENQVARPIQSLTVLVSKGFYKIAPYKPLGVLENQMMVMAASASPTSVYFPKAKQLAHLVDKGDALKIIGYRIQEETVRGERVLFIYNLESFQFVDDIPLALFE